MPAEGFRGMKWVLFFMLSLIFLGVNSGSSSGTHISDYPKRPTNICVLTLTSSGTEGPALGEK